jgi:hypothetical protein
LSLIHGTGLFRTELESVLVLVAHGRRSRREKFHNQSSGDQGQGNIQDRHHGPDLAVAMPRRICLSFTLMCSRLSCFAGALFEDRTIGVKFFATSENPASVCKRNGNQTPRTLKLSGNNRTHIFSLHSAKPWFFARTLTF